MKRALYTVAILGFAGAAVAAPRPSTESDTAPAFAPSPGDSSIVLRRVYEGPGPDFWGTNPSPDGRYVTQTDWDTGDLAILDLLTGQEVRLTGKKDDGWLESSAYNEMARFSPDGQRIAYSWYNDVVPSGHPYPGTYQVRVINRDGSDSRVLAQSPVDEAGDIEWWPDVHGWTPDGESVLVTFYRGAPEENGIENAVVEITLVSASDGSMRVIHRVDPEKQVAFAAISPDGRYLAFDQPALSRTERSPHRAAEMDIYVKPVSGGAPVAVVDGPSTDMVLGWMETGDLLFYSDRDLTEGVWRLPMRAGRASGDPVQVAGDLWGMEAIGLAGDMLLFGVQTETPRLHTVPLDLGRNRLLGSPVPVEQEVRPSRSPSWSLDGEKLMYWASVREPGGQGGRLVVRSTAGGGSIDVTPRDLQIRGRPRWSRDGRSVRVLGRQLDGSDEGLYSYNMEDGSSRLLFSLQPGFVRRMEFTGDGPAVYAPGREADGSGVVVRFDLDSGDRVPLLTRPPRTDAAAPILGMGLSPDGETLALWESSDPAGAQILRLVPTSGGEGTVLLEIAFGDDVVKPRCEGARVPLWTPDGEHVLTVLRNLPADEPIPEHPCRLFKIPIDGGEPEFVGNLPEFSGEWALSPDGRRLAIGSGDNRGEIWMLHGVSGTY